MKTTSAFFSIKIDLQSFVSVLCAKLYPLLYLGKSWCCQCWWYDVHVHVWCVCDVCDVYCVCVYVYVMCMSRTERQLFTIRVQGWVGGEVAQSGQLSQFCTASSSSVQQQKIAQHREHPTVRKGVLASSLLLTLDLDIIIAQNKHPTNTTTNIEPSVRGCSPGVL